MNNDIFECCREGDLGSVKRLIKEHKVLYGIKNESGFTPLHSASWFGKLKIIKYLVEEVGANTEVQDRFGDTPLHNASRCDHLEILKYFIRHDVDTSIKNNRGETFLDLLGGKKKKRNRRNDRRSSMEEVQCKIKKILKDKS